MTTHSVQISAKALKEIGDFVQYHSFTSAGGKSDDTYILLVEDDNGWGTIHLHDQSIHRTVMCFRLWE